MIARASGEPRVDYFVNYWKRLGFIRRNAADEFFGGLSPRGDGAGGFLRAGRGAAGLAFATLAARAGARVIVAERTRYDRPRPGEHLAGAIRPALAQLGVPRAAAAAILEQSPGIVVAWGNSCRSPIPMPAVRPARPSTPIAGASIACSGDTAAAAGAICMPAARLAEATPVAGQSWQIRLATAAGPRAIAAGLVIDASGRRAAFARRQGAARRRAGDLVALTTWYAAEGRRAAAQPLVVAAGGAGWWSLTATPDQGYAATFLPAPTCCAAATVNRRTEPRRSASLRPWSPTGSQGPRRSPWGGRPSPAARK